MSSAINTVCQITRTFIGVGQLATSIHKAVDADRNQELRYWEVVAGAVSFFFNTMGAVGQPANFSNSALSTIKSLETLGIMMKTAPIMTRVIIEWIDGEKGTLEAIEEGILAPTAGMIRVATECAIYSYKHLATLDDEHRYIIVSHGGLNNRTFERVYLSVEECNARADHATHILPYANVAEISLNLNLVSTALLKSFGLYKTLLGDLFLQNAAIMPQLQAPAPILVLAPVAAPPAIQAQPASAPNDQIIVLDPTHWTEIPSCLEEDPFFSRYVCPITSRPIRDPVIDPNGTTLYERSEILKWVRRNGTSPMTRQPLAPHQLRDATALKMAIDQRLSGYQRLLLNAIAQGNVTPVAPNVQAQVDGENPNY